MHTYEPLLNLRFPDKRTQLMQVQTSEEKSNMRYKKKLILHTGICNELHNKVWAIKCYANLLFVDAKLTQNNRTVDIIGERSLLQIDIYPVKGFAWLGRSMDNVEDKSNNPPG